MHHPVIICINRDYRFHEQKYKVFQSLYADQKKYKDIMSDAKVVLVGR